jgi:hypothetical protein
MNAPGKKTIRKVGISFASPHPQHAGPHANGAGFHILDESRIPCRPKARASGGEGERFASPEE